MGALRLTDGFSTTVYFLGNGDALSLPNEAEQRFFEKTVKVPGTDGGTPINTTSMRNINRETWVPRKLKRNTEMVLKASYRSDALQPAYIDAMVNIIQVVLVVLPDQSEYAFWGAIVKTEPDDNKEGTEPEMTVNVVCCNSRHVPAGDANPNDVERDPVYAFPEDGDITVADMDP